MDEAWILPAIATLVLAILIYIAMSPRKGDDISTGLQKEQDTKDPPASDDKILNPATFRAFKLQEIILVSHNTKLFRFEIPQSKSIGLGIGRHISVRADIAGNNVIRAYTPTSHPNQTGHFDLLIKTYETGKLSPYLHSLAVGDKVDIRGPVGRFKYQKNMYPRMGLIAGGTGLTPCLQVIRCILSADYVDDNTTFVLLYQNRTEADILLRSELDALMTAYPARLQIIYFLSNASTTTYGHKSNERRGYICLDALNEFMNIRSCPFVGLCGPSGFNDAMKGMLKKVGHTGEESVYVW